MNLPHFEMFCEVARVKSFSKAAKLLHLSQPAVSAQIHYLEDYYGMQLFNRSSSGVSLTAVGEMVYKYAKEILKLHDELENEIDSMLQSENQKLIIGASSTIGNSALPCGIWTFKEKYPQAQIKLEVHNAERILALLNDNQLNLALLENPISGLPDDLVSQPISNDELLVIAPANPPWVDRTTITLEEIKTAPFIIREQGSGLRQIFEEAITSWGMKLSDLNIVTEMSSTSAIKSTVEAGLGLSICSRIATQKEIRTGTIHPLTIEGKSVKFSYQLVYKSEKSLNNIAKRFIRFILGPGAPFC